MTDYLLCNYEEVGRNGNEIQYRCVNVGCGHVRTSIYPPELLRRHCSSSVAPPKKDPRERLEAELRHAVDANNATRTWPEIQATLAKCFGGCRHYNGTVCTYRGGECQHWQAWRTFLLLRDCEQFEVSKAHTDRITTLSKA